MSQTFSNHVESFIPVLVENLELLDHRPYEAHRAVLIFFQPQAIDIKRDIPLGYYMAFGL